MKTLSQIHSAVKLQLPPDTLLAFELGDFDEFFGPDAVVAAGVLGLALTHRDGSPMSGYPKHARGKYAEKLTVAGLRLAVTKP